MDKLDAHVYYTLKENLRKVIKNIDEGNLFVGGHMPVILIDFWAFETLYFESESHALDHLQKYADDWDDSPPDGIEEELIIYKFCTGDEKAEYPLAYDDYKFFKETNNHKIYREKSFVHFEPQYSIHVSI